MENLSKDNHFQNRKSRPKTPTTKRECESLKRGVKHEICGNMAKHEHVTLLKRITIFH
jgi:hypothetical protein